MEHLAHERAVSVIRRIVEYVDAPVGNEEDLQMGLHFAGRASLSRSQCLL